MCKMNKYKSLKRTTLDNMDDLPHYGVYIIAYMGRVLYVGKANDSVVGRLKSHLYKCDVEDVGGWMFKQRLSAPEARSSEAQMTGAVEWVGTLGYAQARPFDQTD